LLSEQIPRTVVGLRVSEGTSEIQRLIISRGLERRGVPQLLEL
jgi:alkylation response protein AidB-like acyl-CoA dehydrogenase